MSWLYAAAFLVVAAPFVLWPLRGGRRRRP